MYQRSPSLAYPHSSRTEEQSILDIQDMDRWEVQVRPESKAYPSCSERYTLSARDPKAAEERAYKEIGLVNWVGRLNEFRMARVNHEDRCEAEYKIESDYCSKSPRYSCSVKIPETSLLLGSSQDATTFTAKKPAKQYAAKKAIDWLIMHNYMPPDGSIQFPKTSGQHVPSAMSKESFTTQVPILCRRLGFTCPRYVLDPVFPGSPIYNAYADFGNDPRVRGFIGQVTNIYGKKNAKEEVASLVVEFLSDLEEQRLQRHQSIRKRLN